MNLLPIHAKKSLLTGILFFFIYSSINAQGGAAAATTGDAAQGKQVFQQNCASCHNLDKDMTGPALRGVTTRAGSPWAENIDNLKKWIHNAPAFIGTTQYTQDLQKKYGSLMTNFSSTLSEKDIDNVIAYLENPPSNTPKNPTNTPPGEEPSGNGALIFGILSLILALIALILMQVNSNLKKLSDDKENIIRPEPVPFYRNKIYIALLALVLFVVGGYFVAKGAINLGRQKGYSPTQPIYFSHRIHAGINQINCLYCHGGAWESKHAGIPTLNICMNCHKAITSYADTDPKIYDENGDEVNANKEIQKLFEYAGFTPGPGATWDPAKGKSPAWIKIHNLPDHVFFSHAQHVRVGNVQCQTCHGNIQQMDKVQQMSELSMGWCINCHRETKVNFNYNDSTGNKFYSIYEKFHNDFEHGKMDSIRVKDIGGMECQKCHY